MALAATDVQAQSFVPTGTMTRPRSEYSATLLQDGRVLIAGGDPDKTPSAEIYDPLSGTFAETGAPIQLRSNHAAVLLRDGRVLLVGGCQPCAAIAEIYNPKTGTFARTGNMSHDQWVYSAVLLKNGKVLVIGQITAELFDPATETFVSLSSTGGWHVPVGGWNGPYGFMTATLLADGTVLLASGSSVLLYDPVNEVFRQLPTKTIPLAEATATPLLDGSVLFIGGNNGDVVWEEGPLAGPSMVYDPGIQIFKPKANMTTGRTPGHTATMLKDGRVLIAGGRFDGLESAELYNPATGTFSRTTDMLRSRTYHTATLLRDGRVLITGGGLDATAELFVPESTQGAVPRVTLDWSRYCVGDSWILRAEAAAPSTSVQISGTSDGSLWTIPEWTTTGQDGALLATGTYTAEAASDYTLWLYVGGKVSNTVSVRVENCSVHLELNSNFHVGDSWIARVTGAMPGANVSLLGIWGASPWIIESWGRTDSDGTFVTSGNFPPGTEDNHALRVTIGAAQSNEVRFKVID
jgi:hypothetical protein